MQCTTLKGAFLGASASLRTSRPTASAARAPLVVRAQQEEQVVKPNLPLDPPNCSLSAFVLCLSRAFAKWCRRLYFLNSVAWFALISLRLCLYGVVACVHSTHFASCKGW